VRARIAAALGRLLDALSDPKRGVAPVIAVLAAYCAAWTVYAVIAKASQDFHFDMGEMVAWSREVTFGTPKHPPLPAWLAGAWFSVFPLAPWAYDLFAMVGATVSIGIAVAVSRRYLDGVKRAVGLAFLTLVPFFNFHAFKFNANSAMMPWWALTTWLFLRSFEASSSPTSECPSTARRMTLAVLAGVGAGAAMLVKYWAVVLLAGMVVAAVADPRRHSYFRSAAPYLTAAAGVAVLSPHLVWLWHTDFASFAYMLESHPGTHLEALGSGIGYAAAALAYAAVPIGFTALIAGRDLRAAVPDMLWPASPPRRLAVLVFFLPLVVPLALAVATSEKAVSLWACGGMTLLPVVLLSSPKIVVPRAAAVRILGTAVAFPLLAILAAPAVAVVTHINGVANYGDQYRLIADAAARFWHDTTGKPVGLVGSHDNVMNGSVFYFEDRPSTFDIQNPQLTPWADAARIARDGALLYCPLAETTCMAAMNRIAAVHDNRRTEVELSRSFLGMPGRVTRYAIVAILPAAPAR